MNTAQIAGPFPDLVLSECYLFRGALASFSLIKTIAGGIISATDE